MKKIDSDALGEIGLALGMTGAGSPVTELADGVVDQVLSINEIARRSQTLGVTTGFFSPTLRTVHTDAETQVVQVDPYNIGTVNAVAPYPAVVPRGSDFWLLGASIRRVSGTGTLLATLSLVVGTRAQGFGEDDSGNLILVSQPIRLAYWDGLVTVNTTFAIKNGARGPHARIGYRVPRNAQINFTSTSTLTSTYDCQLICGLFPTALGQDVLV